MVRSVSLTVRFEQTLVYAAQLHGSQRRKVTQTPYIAHLLSVAALVLEDGGGEDEAIAALLHDAVEDQGGLATRAEIGRRFGERVTAIVEGCTEPPRQPNQSWRSHKQQYLDQIQQVSSAVQRVVLADKLHNGRSLLVNLRLHGEETWRHFEGTKEEILWLYRVQCYLFRQISQSGMVAELEQVVAELGQTLDRSDVTLWISQPMLSARAMYTRPSIEQTEPPRSPKETLPTMYDLPSDNAEEPGLSDEFHYLQPQLLSATFRLTDYSREQIFTSGDLNLYYDSRHPLWYKRPDWFAAVGVPRLYEQRDLRLSYVVWQEGVSPIVVVEFLSPGTENEDLGKATRTADQPPTKWEVYEQILRIPYYAVFDRYTDRLRAFTLVSGQYQELELSESRFWMPALKLGLGLWQGEYGDVERQWLRWYDAEGNWILTKAERLAERLRSMGVDPDEDI